MALQTPIGATDQNDCDLRCLINRLSGRRPLISPFDLPPQNGPLPNGQPGRTLTPTTPAPDTGYISILLPVFLVIGVVILVVIIFLLHRFVSILIKKRTRSGRNNDSSNSQSDRNGQSRSNDFDDSPPSYLQMMGSLENSDMPPSYYEIVKGKVNLGFLSEDGNSGELGDRVEQVSEVDATDSDAIQQDSDSNLPNAVAVTAEQSKKDEKTDDSFENKKITRDGNHQRTKINIEEEIDSLSVPTVFSSSPVAQPRSLSRRNGNIKMLKIVPQLAAKRFKSLGGDPDPDNQHQAAEDSQSESSLGSVL